MKSIGIHIFRKDLRVVDNLALNELASRVDTIIPIFILDPSQIERTPTNRNHFSPRAARFILDSLLELQAACDNKLCVLRGSVIKSLRAVCAKRKPVCISFNADYSAYALKRDREIVDWCRSQGIETVINYDDQTLRPMDKLTKSDGSPYLVYGSFYKHARTRQVTLPKTAKISFINPVASLAVSVSYIRSTYRDDANHFIGGRSYGLSKLHTKRSIDGFKHRDILINKSFELSPYLNFGCLSVREVYQYFYRHKIPAAKELHWRDFFQCILRYKPGASSYTHPMDSRFRAIKWRSVKSKQSVHEWISFIECRTGYLLIDAGMRQLQSTGYIGNRMRLLLATFWTKYLMIDPLNHEYGAQSGFSRLLTDCSTSQNKLNHQWITSELDLSGRRFAKRGAPAISGRMIRVDNQIINKYDPELKYISTWLPEWKDKSRRDVKAVKTLFDWEQRYQEYCDRVE